MGQLEEGLHPSETPLCGKHDDSQTKDRSPKDIGESPSSASKEEIEAAVHAVQSSYSRLATEKRDLELCKTSAPSPLQQQSMNNISANPHAPIMFLHRSPSEGRPDFKKDSGLLSVLEYIEALQSPFSGPLQSMSNISANPHAPIMIPTLQESPPSGRPDFKKDSGLLSVLEYIEALQSPFSGPVQQQSMSNISANPHVPFMFPRPPQLRRKWENTYDLIRLRREESYKDNIEARDDSPWSSLRRPVQQQSMSNISANPHVPFMFPRPPQRRRQESDKDDIETRQFPPRSSFSRVDQPLETNWTAPTLHRISFKDPVQQQSMSNISANPHVPFMFPRPPQQETIMDDIEARYERRLLAFSRSMFAPSLAIEKTDLDLYKTSAPTWPDFENTIFRQCESFDLMKHVATAVHAALSSDSGWPDFESSSPDSEDIETGDKPDDDSLQSAHRRRRVTRKERKAEPYKWSATTKKKPPGFVDPASSHLENIVPAEVDSLEPAGRGISLKRKASSGHSKQNSPHRDLDF